MSLKTKQTILIVEDEPALSRALREKFTHEGFYVLDAKNGEEGLALALHDHPDIIILDVIMPVMDGATMLQKLRHDPWGAKARVIVLTNLSGSEDTFVHAPHGFLEIILKSNLKLEEMVGKVRTCLEQHNVH